MFSDKIVARFGEKNIVGKLINEVLLHDNAPAHRAQQAVQTADQYDFEVLPHPTLFTRLCPLEFFFFFLLFPNLKKKKERNSKDSVSMTTMKLLKIG